MKLFLAGLYTSNFNKHSRVYNSLTDAERAHRDALPYCLESYHYVKKQSFIDAMVRDNVSVFLDSGAYSAYTQGVETDIDAYCKYIHDNHNIIDVASVLDGIGDAKKTLENQQIMESMGTTPLPCFHYGEDESYLKYYIENYEYITIGGMVPISSPQLKVWLDRIWGRYLTDANGKPRVKVHGFGLTTYSLMQRYPWYSVDSSTWVQTARVGAIFMPSLQGTISVSDRSPSRKIAGTHIDNITEEQRNELIRRIEARGFDIDRLRTLYEARWIYCCWAFKHVGELHNKETFFKEAMELF